MASLSSPVVVVTRPNPKQKPRRLFALSRSRSSEQSPHNGAAPLRSSLSSSSRGRERSPHGRERAIIAKDWATGSGGGSETTTTPLRGRSSGRSSSERGGGGSDRARALSISKSDKSASSAMSDADDRFKYCNDLKNGEDGPDAPLLLLGPVNAGTGRRHPTNAKMSPNLSVSKRVKKIVKRMDSYGDPAAGGGGGKASEASRKPSPEASSSSFKPKPSFSFKNTLNSARMASSQSKSLSAAARDVLGGADESLDGGDTVPCTSPRSSQSRRLHHEAYSNDSPPHIISPLSMPTTSPYLRRRPNSSSEAVVAVPYLSLTSEGTPSVDDNDNDNESIRRLRAETEAVQELRRRSQQSSFQDHDGGGDDDDDDDVVSVATSVASEHSKAGALRAEAMAQKMREELRWVEAAAAQKKGTMAASATNAGRDAVTAANEPEDPETAHRNSAAAESSGGRRVPAPASSPRPDVGPRPSEPEKAVVRHRIRTVLAEDGQKTPAAASPNHPSPPPITPPPGTTDTITMLESPASLRRTTAVQRSPAATDDDSPVARYRRKIKLARRRRTLRAAVATAATMAALTAFGLVKHKTSTSMFLVDPVVMPHPTTIGELATLSETPRSSSSDSDGMRRGQELHKEPYASPASSSTTSTGHEEDSALASPSEGRMLPATAAGHPLVRDESASSWPHRQPLAVVGSAHSGRKPSPLKNNALLVKLFRSHPMGAYYASAVPPHESALLGTDVPFAGMGIGDGY